MRAVRPVCPPSIKHQFVAFFAHERVSRARSKPLSPPCERFSLGGGEDFAKEGPSDFRDVGRDESVRPAWTGVRKRWWWEGRRYSQPASVEPAMRFRQPPGTATTVRRSQHPQPP